MMTISMMAPREIAGDWVQDWPAKAICKGCPVLAECLADALDNRTEFGVWGGMTERERRALLRRRPDVRSWAAVLQEAKARPLSTSA